MGVPWRDEDREEGTMISSRALLSLLGAMALTMLLAGCPAGDDDDSATGDDDVTGDDDTGDDDVTGDDDSAGDDDTSGDDDTVPPWFGVSGEVLRTAALDEGGDGIGTLCIGVLDVCDLGAVPLFGAQIDDVDISVEGVARSFGFSVPNGALADGSTYLLGAFFAEDAIDCQTHVPAGGELYGSDCPSFLFEIEGAAGPLEVVLDSTVEDTPR
jgi:hypothetical protein